MSESHAELTATQQQTAQHLLNILRENLGQKIIVLLLGISGVGKTLLLNLLGSRISELGGSIVTPCDLLYHDSQDPRPSVKEARGLLVCAVTHDEQRRILERVPAHFAGWRPVELILKGMSGDEIAAYISPKMPEGMKLSLEQLARYSLGIPLLADDLLALNLTEEHAFRLAAKHFFWSTGWTSDLNEAWGLVNRFLNTPPPVEFFEDFPNKVFSVSDFEERKIYDALWSFRAMLRGQKQFQHRDEEKTPDPDPMFIAPESEGIYDGMLSGGSRVANMHIHVPSMSPKQAESILSMLGFRFEFGNLYDLHYTKLKLFGASYRKVSFCFNNQGVEAVHANECNFIESLAKLYLSKVVKGQYPPLVTRRNNCSLTVEAHDHHGLTLNPIRIGWGMEAILQHHRVSYLVNNPICNKLYAYDAKTQHIVELGEAEEIPVWSLKPSKRSLW